MKIILASASPRRRELLETIGITDFIVCPALGDEIIDNSHSPAQIVMELSAQKAREVAEKYPADLIIAADTVVSIGGKTLGKPADEGDAKAMLERLSGNAHEVFTGVTAIKDGCEICIYEQTQVFFRDMSEREILAYIKTGEPMDKAGSYGIQGRGAVFVQKIIGDYFNVMGLPLCRLGTILSELGVNVI